MRLSANKERYMLSEWFLTKTLKQNLEKSSHIRTKDRKTFLD